MGKKEKGFLMKAGAVVLFTSALATTALLIGQTNNTRGDSTTNQTQTSIDQELPSESRHSSMQQVEKIAEALNADLDIMQSRYRMLENYNVFRLDHNSGDPINVAFYDGYPENFKKVAVEALDYVFSILGSVNDNYAEYNIIDEKEYKENDDARNKTRIFFGVDNIENPEYGLIYGSEKETIYVNDIADFKDMSVVDMSTININFDAFNKNDYEKMLYTYTHELMHSVGFCDVYNKGSNKVIDKYVQNTFMNNNVNGQYEIMPNDYAAILSAYAQPMGDDELTEYIEAAEVKLAEYEDYYYGKQIYNYAENNPEFKDKFESFEDNNEQINLTNVKTHDGGDRVIENYSVSISGDDYKIVITDNEGNVYDTMSGKCRLIDGVYVLKGVDCKECFSPLTCDESVECSGVVTDLYIYKGDDQVYIYNPSNKNVISSQNDDSNDLTNER